jgi:RimJ/RimL family protein N-acetyltransferase
MLQGEKTRIRPLEIGDLETLYQWYSDPDFLLQINGGWPLSSFLRRQDIESRFYDDDPHRYSILGAGDTLIGTIGFDEVNVPARSARLFVGLGQKNDWNQGLGSDALGTFIDYLFNYWNFRRLSAETWSGNSRAVACYEKLGFSLEGTLREAYYSAGQYWDGLIYSLIKSQS